MYPGLQQGVGEVVAEEGSDPGYSGCDQLSGVKYGQAAGLAGMETRSENVRIRNVLKLGVAVPRAGYRFYVSAAMPAWPDRI